MIDELFIAIEKYTKVTAEQIKGRKRQRSSVYARMYFAYIMKNYNTYTLSSIGDIINKDHTTIMYYLQAVEDMIYCDKISNKFSITETIINKIKKEIGIINE